VAAVNELVCLKFPPVSNSSRQTFALICESKVLECI